MNFQLPGYNFPEANGVEQVCLVMTGDIVNNLQVTVTIEPSTGGS